MNDKVVILLATYNGESFLKEQIDSLLNQSYKDIKIVARDDNSSDKTLEILNFYDIEILEATKNIGACNSFGKLLEYALSNTNSEYFMFCDQDDVWEKDKIKNSLKKIKEMENSYGEIPLLVHTNLIVVDKYMKSINKSFWKYQNINPKFNSLNRLLVQNTITGCTMMINKKLGVLSTPINNNAMMHDRWIGLVASVFGKIGIIYDAQIQYRQHNENCIGAKGFDIKYILKNLFEFKRVNLDNHIRQVEAFLERYGNKISKEDMDIINGFIKIKQSSWIEKRLLLVKYGFFKYGLIRNMGWFLKI